MSSAVAASLLGIMLIFLVLFAANSTRASRVPRMFSVFSIVFGFVNFVVPIVTEYRGVSEFSVVDQGALSHEYGEAVFLALMYYCVCALVFFLLSQTQPTTRSLRLSAVTVPPKERGLISSLLIVQFLSAIATLLIIIPGLAGNYSEFMNDRIAVQSGLGYVTAGLWLGVPISLLLTAPLLAGAKTTYPRWALAILPLLLSAIAGIILGSRLMAVVGLCYILLSGAFLGSIKINRKKIAAVAALAFAVVVLLGSAREAVKQGTYEDGALLGELAFTTERVAREVTGNFGQLEWLALAKNREGIWSYARGQTYLAAVALPIPRILWPDKPVGAGPMLANIIRPGTYDLSRKYNSSRTTGCVTEAYLNGGTIGVIVVAVLHGLALCMITKVGRAAKTRSDYVVYFLGSMFICESMIYGEFLGAFAKFGMYAFPIVVYVLVRMELTRLKARKPRSRPWGGGTNDAEAGDFSSSNISSGV